MSAPENAALPFSILTDLPSPAEWHKRCRKACAKVPALDEVLTMVEQREIPGPNGEKIALAENDLTLRQAELLFYLQTQLKPILSVETGFGTGLAAAVLTCGHLYNDLQGGHVPIQNLARDVENGIGAFTLERLNLTGYQIMEHESGLVLPQIYLQKLNQGLSLAYFNSAESFDEQMMEYFYMNRLINEGGVMVVNTQSAVRRKFVDFIRSDRHDYAIRDLNCDLTLVQVPQLTALAQQTSQTRH